MFLTTKEVVIFCSKFCDRHIWVDEQLENKCCKRAICQTTLTAFIKFANTILIFFITLSYCHQQELYRVCTISNFSDTLESVTCSIHPQMMLMIGGKIRFHFFLCNFSLTFCNSDNYWYKDLQARPLADPSGDPS